MVYTLSFFSLSSKCSLFRNSNVFGSCFIHILYTVCAKIKKKNNSGVKRLKWLTGSHNRHVGDDENVKTAFFKVGAVSAGIVSLPTSSVTRTIDVQINQDTTHKELQAWKN